MRPMTWRLTGWLMLVMLAMLGVTAAQQRIRLRLAAAERDIGVFRVA